MVKYYKPTRSVAYFLLINITICLDNVRVDKEVVNN